MKTNYLMLLFLAVLTFTFTGCEAIEGIFKAGVWSGVIMVVAVVGLIIFIIAKIAGGKK